MERARNEVGMHCNIVLLSGKLLTLLGALSVHFYRDFNRVMKVTNLIKKEKPNKGSSSSTDGKKKAVEEKASCTTAKEKWPCSEEAYLQITKDKKFQLKQ